jgi:glycosyltransferase involved in cell wall biosynthesis
LKRLLTIGHSYIVEQNRHLGHELARQGGGRWDVTIAAPASIRGEPHANELHVRADEPCRVRPLKLRFSSQPHVRMYTGGIRALMREHWDVIHIWQEPYVLAAGQIASAAPRGAKIVPATFQNIRKRYPAPLRIVEGRVMSRADGWIAFGETAHEAQRARGMYAIRPARVIPLGVDLPGNQPQSDRGAVMRRRLGLRTDAPVVGFVGRLTAEKGLQVLTRALADLRQPWQALFVGRGHLERDLRAFAAAHGGRVQIVTDAAHEEVAGYLHAMDLLCAPSQTVPHWREQFGRMLIEAMACSVPVAASRSGEIPHVVGDAGVILSEDDVGEWRDSIAALLDDPGRREVLAVRGRARVSERFTWPVVARQHLDFFEALLG